MKKIILLSTLLIFVNLSYGQNKHYVDAKAVLAESNQMFQAKQYKKAINYINKKLPKAEGGPYSVPECHFVKVRCYYKLGKNDNVISSCQEALRIARRDYGVNYNATRMGNYYGLMAHAYSALGNKSKACDFYKIACDWNRNYCEYVCK